MANNERFINGYMITFITIGPKPLGEFQGCHVIADPRDNNVHINPYYDPDVINDPNFWSEN